MADIKKQRKNQIYWHKKDIKIEFDTFSSEESAEPISTNNIYAPGPKAEPPFEVEILASRFLYKNGKEASLYIIRIASLVHSWMLIKSIAEIVDLINLIKDRTTILNKLSMKRFKCISVENYKERYSMIQLILSTLLNNPDYYKYIQQFILTNTISDSVDIHRVEEALENEEKDGVFLVEYKGWMLGWKVHYIQLLNNVIVSTSVHSGKVKSLINIRDIKIINRIVKIQGEGVSKELVAHDKMTVEIVKKWMYSASAY
ncbi:uncharacterized protein NEMAJ01_1572 [Nematocida major]|uniref:uncharacterized protein n=1 Tax=Nematocida major TaxID=1912982 RepID=UPI0020077E74|nr:uncharacterized protein NEMAJ01_1572 [Nematocida major]KAH9386676.1 hypothetical protein NEMAJ01_1572 [Nematocida major]